MYLTVSLLAGQRSGGMDGSVAELALIIKSNKRWQNKYHREVFFTFAVSAFAKKS
jgi:hypothetical protein